MRSSSTRLFVVAGLLLTLALALVVSPFADLNPDGLERVAEDEGFAQTETDHAFGDSPVADYALRGVDDDRIGTGLAGVIGVLVTFGVGLALFALLRVRRAMRPPEPAGGEGN